ncbi:dihydropteroate synthase [Cognatishimia maritima]|uniref:Dihydropteroate synthase n=1 Tax=Cognatishimia maritima TaxID=870908 RepID=A0A1M5UY33_9RHOB|nr:dihydropteroate synthase [Cognatishimia maritima]SHH67922.1 dihydropteroate synthase [Cognatishimia maritima]
MTTYFRPIPQTDIARPDTAQTLAGGWAWFTHVECLERGKPARVIAASQVPEDVIAKMTRARSDIAGLSMKAPKIMGILNVTPDSFSDGGRFNAPDQAVARTQAMIDQGADLIDIGGESTRPGSNYVEIDEETARTAPVIAAVAPNISAPISIDTRKAPVAAAALEAGAAIINDVSGFTFDAGLADLAVTKQVPVCVMHAQGDPATMQDDPSYDDVLLDVFDFLDAQVRQLEAKGLQRDQIIVDPGIGFGKALTHNLALLARLSLFHSLGCPILLGASRKALIGHISGAKNTDDRMPGSLAIALAGIQQGVQFLRVHDVAETQQALTLWQAATQGAHDVA